MGLKAAIMKRRRRRAYRRAVDELFENLDAYFKAAQCESREEKRSLADKVLDGDAVVLGVNENGKTIVAEKRDVPTGIPGDDNLRRFEVDQDRLWDAESARIDLAHRQLRQQFNEERAGNDGVAFGVNIAGGERRNNMQHVRVSHDGSLIVEQMPVTSNEAATDHEPIGVSYKIGLDVDDGIVTATCLRFDQDGTGTQVAVARHNISADPCCGLFESCERACVPRGRWQVEQELAARVEETDREDVVKITGFHPHEIGKPCTARCCTEDGCCTGEGVDVKAAYHAMKNLSEDNATPNPVDIGAAMRAGVCDDTGLLGATVLYETDGRGGKRYALPAIITVVQRTHPDLPFLRAAEEQGYGCERTTQYNVGGTWFDTLHGERRNTSNNEELLGMGVVSFNDGIKVNDNPVPIPHDGTLHLKVLTPGPKGTYDEFSVPYDPHGGPRTWRFRSLGDAPF